MFATVRNLEKDSKRITEVLTSITTISTVQTKERDRLARGLRHDDGKFTPIVLTTAHQSPGRHVYDRHETMTRAERSELLLQGRNARSRNLTPILAKVNEEHYEDEVEVNRTPYFAGFRRSLMQRREEIAKADAMAAVEAQKLTVPRGYMREVKEPIITSQAGTPVTFANATPSFTLPTGSGTPAQALNGGKLGKTPG